MNDDDFKGRIPAAQLMAQTAEIESHYSHVWAQRYGSNPILNDQDRPHLRWAQTTFGVPRAKELLGHYLKMDTKWFMENAHSLSVFHKSINQVVASLGKPKERGANELLIEDRAVTLAWYIRKSDMVRIRYALKENEHKEVLHPNTQIPMSDDQLVQWVKDTITEPAMSEDDWVTLQRIMHERTVPDLPNPLKVILENVTKHKSFEPKK